MNKQKKIQTFKQYSNIESTDNQSLISEGGDVNVYDFINSIFSKLDEIKKDANNLIDTSLRGDIGYMVTNKLSKQAEKDIDFVKTCNDFIKEIMKEHNLKID